MFVHNPRHGFIFIDEAFFVKERNFVKGPIARLENNSIVPVSYTIPKKTNEQPQLSIWQSKIVNEAFEKTKLIIEDKNRQDLKKIKNRISYGKKKINSNMTMKKKKKLKKKIDKLKRRLKKLKKKIDELKRKVKKLL